MSDSKNPISVVGLYSYPKSGNTWLRAIVAGATHMPMGPGVMQRYVTDTHYGKAMSNPWTFQERDWYFYKSHLNSLMTHDEGQPLTTDKVVYIYRHPLDVFVSYLNFVSGNVSPNAGKSLPFQFDKVEDLTESQMEQMFQIFLKHATLVPKNKAFGGVFEHLANFRKLGTTMPVHIMRYEDLYDGFDDAVGEMCEFLELKDIDIRNARNTSDRRTRKNGKFFWKRQKDNYRNFVNDDQIARFVARWGDEMHDMGYDVA